MAVLDVIKEVFDTPSIIVLEIVKYHKLSSEEKENYKALYIVEKIIPHLYLWLLIQMYIAIHLFM